MKIYMFLTVETCRVSCQNKFVDFVHLVCFIRKNKDLFQSNTAKVLKNHITDYLCQVAMTV